MSTKIPIPLRISYHEDDLLLDFEKSDKYNYIRLHLIYSSGSHVGGTNLLSFAAEGIEFYLRFQRNCSREKDIIIIDIFA